MARESWIRSSPSSSQGTSPAGAVRLSRANALASSRSNTCSCHSSPLMASTSDARIAQVEPVPTVNTKDPIYCLLRWGCS
ncbi:hypothetical protein D3C77_486690 [compost metagenome]